MMRVRSRREADTGKQVAMKQLSISTRSIRMLALRRRLTIWEERRSWATSKRMYNRLPESVTE